MKHTPGPWECTIYSGAFDQPLIISESGVIGRLHSFPERQHEANARLVASAPEMLETLKRVSRYFIDLQNRCALTSSEERLWKEVSRMIYQKNEEENEKESS